jgi:hypothetical protein
MNKYYMSCKLIKLKKTFLLQFHGNVSRLGPLTDVVVVVVPLQHWHWRFRIRNWILRADFVVAVAGCGNDDLRSMCFALHAVGHDFVVCNGEGTE